MPLWELLYNEPILREALKRRAKRNYRRMTDEARAILAEALREEVEAIRREQEQAQGGNAS
ncbi:MAG: hypothetical protein WHS44_10595 [Fimbriimonadales bacterium]|nr:MAG: hypothetical protein KatS3mg018_2265 [Fimbriimonadales bacterium]